MPNVRAKGEEKTKKTNKDTDDIYEKLIKFYINAGAVITPSVIEGMVRRNYLLDLAKFKIQVSSEIFEILVKHDVKLTNKNITEYVEPEKLGLYRAIEKYDWDVIEGYINDKNKPDNTCLIKALKNTSNQNVLFTLIKKYNLVITPDLLIKAGESKHPRRFELIDLFYKQMESQEKNENAKD